MERHHGALAEADQREVEAGKLMPRQLGVEKSVEARPRRFDAAPALVRIAEGEAEPLPAHGSAGAGLGRMGRHEGRVGQPALPLPPDLDQIVAVGAVAVQEDDELLRPAGSGAGVGR